MEYSIAPSALAYLFGDMLEDVFAGRASWFGRSETLPCCRVEVNREDLATVMVTAAFLHLAEEGNLILTLGTTGRILKSKTVFAAFRSRRPGQYLGGLEGEIVSNMSGFQMKNDVKHIVERLLGRHWSDPWREIIRRARRYLLYKGYFAEEERHGIAKLLGKKLIPQCGRILALEKEAWQLGKMMAAFQASQSELYERLWKCVEGGIASRVTPAPPD